MAPSPRRRCARHRRLAARRVPPVHAGVRRRDTPGTVVVRPCPEPPRSSRETERATPTPVRWKPRRQPRHRHRPSLRPLTRPARRWPAHAARGRAHRTRPDHQDPLPAGLSRRRDLPAADPTQLNRTESRHALARAVFHGQRGQLRQRYREGQEDQRGALGLVVNAIVLWNTRYQDAALNHLRYHGFAVNDVDIKRLSPLGHEHINLLGRYQFGTPAFTDALRPLRDPNSPDA